MDGDDGGVMAQPTFTLHQPSEPKKKIQKKQKTIYIPILKELCQFEIDHMIQEPGFFLRAHNEALKQEMVNW